MEDFDENGDFFDKAFIFDIEDVCNNKCEDGSKFLALSLENIPNWCVNGLLRIIFVNGPIFFVRFCADVLVFEITKEMEIWL
jgi:hypothetical protein